MNQLHEIVILGGGTAGWLTANLMAHLFSDKEHIKITVIEAPDIDIVGVGEGSTPALKKFFEMINIDESEWMPRCNATYKLNIRFDGWSPNSGINNYSHPFISQTDMFSQRAFIVNCMTRRLGLDVTTQPDLFFLNSVLSHQHKGPVTPDNFPFRMEYGYHFDSRLLGKFLSEVGQRRGVNYKQLKITGAELKDNGDIDYLVTSDGNQVSGDLFVDCSGFSSLLLQKTLGVAFKTFNTNLFNDSAVVIPTAIDRHKPAETVSYAMKNGWCWKIPLTNRYGYGYVYSSDFISPDDAETELRESLGLLDSDVPARHLKMNVGQAEHHWHKNCLALGLSQGFIEPLEATGLHLVLVAVESFVTKYLEGILSDKYQAEFNTKISERFERVRDYIVAHYKLNTRHDSEYWIANRENTHLSESLKRILDVWYHRGDLDAEFQRQKIESHFSSLSWHCLLAGYGAFPGLAPEQPNKGDLYLEQNVESFINGCSLNFKSHQHCLASSNNTGEKQYSHAL